MNYRIHKLSLTLHGTGPMDARRVAQGFARDLRASAPEREPGRVDRTRVDVSLARATSTDDLSRQIADQVLRSLARRS